MFKSVLKRKLQKEIELKFLKRNVMADRNVQPTHVHKFWNILISLFFSQKIILVFKMYV